MSYSYNNKKLKEILDEKSLTKRKVRIALNMANDITVSRWIDGEDIYLERLLELCNKFDFSPFDFIEFDGMPINVEHHESNTPNNIKEIPSDLTELMLQKEQAITEVKLQCQKDVFAVKEELHRQEISSIKEIAELTVRLREEERIRLFEQHDRDMLKSKEEMNELRSLMEQLLSEKNKENYLLQQRLNDIQLQYKELEMSMGIPSTMYQPIAVAEPAPAPYNKQRK